MKITFAVLAVIILALVGFAFEESVMACVPSACVMADNKDDGDQGDKDDGDQGDKDDGDQGNKDDGDA